MKDHKVPDLGLGKVIDLRPDNSHMDGAAIQVNKYYYLAGAQGIRVVFCEEVMEGMPDSYRTGVNMTLLDAVNFAQTFKDFLDKVLAMAQTHMVDSQESPLAS